MHNEQSKNSLFFKLYNNVQLRLYSYLLTVVHNDNDAEEILQETATVLWEKFDQYEQGTNFGAWAITIARYKALHFLRNNKTTRMIFDDDFYEKVSDRAQQTTDDVNDRTEALRRCLENLPQSGSKLLSMRYGKEISIKKISLLTGRSANSLYQYFWKVTQSLRICIEKRLKCQDV